MCDSTHRLQTHFDGHLRRFIELLLLLRQWSVKWAIITDDEQEAWKPDMYIFSRRLKAQKLPSHVPNRRRWWCRLGIWKRGEQLHFDVNSISISRLLPIFWCGSSGKGRLDIHLQTIRQLGPIIIIAKEKDLRLGPHERNNHLTSCCRQWVHTLNNWAEPRH